MILAAGQSRLGSDDTNSVSDTRDKSQWLSADDTDALLETATLADWFRALYLRGLAKLHRDHQLRAYLRTLREGASGRESWHFPAVLGGAGSLPPNGLPLTVNCPLSKKGWLVNVQSPPAHGAGPEAALKYLAA